MDLMIEKKAIHVELGEIKVTLAPMAFDKPTKFEDLDGMNAEKIDDLLYIKRPSNIGVTL
jgi:hypothetical protein